MELLANRRNGFHNHALHSEVLGPPYLPAVRRETVVFCSVTVRHLRYLRHDISDHLQRDRKEASPSVCGRGRWALRKHLQLTAISCERRT